MTPKYSPATQSHTDHMGISAGTGQSQSPTHGTTGTANIGGQQQKVVWNGSSWVRQ